MKKIEAEYSENYVKKFSSADKNDETLKRLEYFNYTKNANTSNRWILKDDKWVKNELKPAPKSPKKALIIYPYSDQVNTAFDKIPKGVKAIFGGLMMNHDHVRFVRVKNIDELTKAVNEFTDNVANKLDTMLMGGHGTSKSIELDSNFTLSMRDTDSWAKISRMKNLFNTDASIVLDSCSTGSLKNTYKNIADKFAENLPGTRVYAPQESVSATNYFFEKGSYQIAYSKKGESIRYLSYKTETDFGIPDQFATGGKLSENAYFDYGEGTWKYIKMTSSASEKNRWMEFRREHSYLYMSKYETTVSKYLQDCCDTFGKGVNKLDVAGDIEEFSPEIFKVNGLEVGYFGQMTKSSWFSSVERLDISNSTVSAVRWVGLIETENTSLKNLNLHKIDFGYNATWDFSNYRNLNSLTITEPIVKKKGILIEVRLSNKNVKINIPEDLRKYFKFIYSDKQ